MQFEFALWTREMVREVIRREFGVRLSVVSVGRLLRKLGLSPQRPLHRAYQQNPKAVDRWKREEYPAIRALAEAEDATIWFADEAGIRSDYHAGTTWSPVGQTPVVKNTGARYSVNMISVVSAKGALRFAVYEGKTIAGSSSTSASGCCTTLRGHRSRRLRASRAPRHRHKAIRRLHRRPADTGLPARLLTRAESR